jgi:hypothetical protein
MRLNEDDSQTVKRRGIGRHISLVGLVLMCVSFFLPQMDGGGGHPAGDAFPWIRGFRIDFAYLLSYALPLTVAFGLLALCAIGMRVREGIKGKLISIGVVVVCTAALAFGAYLACFALPGEPPLWTDLLGSQERPLSGPDSAWHFVAGGLVATTIIACVGLALLRRRQRVPWSLFCYGMAGLIYGFYWPVSAPDQLLYGLWVSILACVLICAGGLWEAVVARR